MSSFAFSHLIWLLSLFQGGPSQDYGAVLKQYVESPTVIYIFDQFKNEIPAVIDDWKALAKLYSPSGDERLRAAYLVNRFSELGLSNVHTDSYGNAVGVINGDPEGPKIVFLGTMDDLSTVAEMVKNNTKPIMEKDGKLFGPGTNSSSTCVSLMALARMFKHPSVSFKGSIYLVGVVQEETGLTGVKGFLKDHTDTDYLIDIMAGIGGISYGAIGIHWFKVYFHGPKGHTLGGGLPNVSRGVARAVDRVFSIPIPQEPPEIKSYLNISMLGAGEVFNHKSDQAYFSVDLRSMDNPTLLRIKKQIIAITKKTAQEESLSYRIEPFSESPAGQLPDAQNSKLVRIAEEAVKQLGYTPSLSNRGSSNMNVGIGLKIPSISTGGNRGGNRNTLDEYVNINPILKGMQLDFLIGFILADGKI